MARPKKIDTDFILDDYRIIWEKEVPKGSIMIHAVLRRYVETSPYREELKNGINNILEKLNSHETIKIYWWSGSLIQISVNNNKWNHHPCSTRFLISYDFENGLFYSRKSKYRYGMARSGWRSFADRFIEGGLTRYGDCGCHIKRPCKYGMFSPC